MGPNGLLNFLSELISSQKLLKVISVQILGPVSPLNLKIATQNWLQKNKALLNSQTISLVIVGGYVVYIDDDLDQPTTRTIDSLDRKCGTEIRQGCTFSHSDAIGHSIIGFLLA